MNHKRPPVPVIVLLVLAVIVAGYFGIRALLTPADTALTASGTIETVEITVSPEIGGKVAEVHVNEGDEVQAGDPLFRLDDTLLQAQRAVASANLDLARAALANAQAQADVTQAAIRAESAATRTSDWVAANPAGYTLPGGTFTRDEMIAAAQAEIDNALSARDDAQSALTELLADPASADFVAAETRLRNDRAAILVAQDVLKAASLSNNNDLQDSAQTAYDDAKSELDDAQTAYDDLADSDAAKAVITARANLAAAQDRYDVAQDRLLALQTGDQSLRWAASVAALEQAQTAVTQAEAALALVDAQIAKLTVTAPMDGTILTRAIQPGETVAIGAKAITLGQLTDLTITVYVPEDRYGELSLGQSATVSVDSFPGETFDATVVHIADQAEFTPRNVQTVEGRASTVFAVKLQVQDPNGKLKPGMPADVTFR